MINSLWMIKLKCFLFLCAMITAILAPAERRKKEKFCCYDCLTFGTFTPLHDEKNVFPSLYQMVPNEIHQYNGIIQLLQHFGWIWIGIMAVDDDYGDMFLQKIEPLLFQNSICYAFLLRTPPKAYIDEYIHLISMVLRYDQLFMDDKVK
ncbi:hypothetical protein E2320_003014, partial [Naja naja]